MRIRTSRRDYQLASLLSKPRLEDRRTEEDIIAARLRHAESRKDMAKRVLRVQDFSEHEEVLVPGGQRGKIDSIDTRFGRIYVRIGRGKASGYSPMMLTHYTANWVPLKVYTGHSVENPIPGFLSPNHGRVDIARAGGVGGDAGLLRRAR